MGRPDMNAPEFTAMGKAGHAFGLIQALGERAMDESVPDAEFARRRIADDGRRHPEMMGIMMDEDTRYRGVPVKVCGENVCTLCTMGKGEGDVAQLEALAVKAGEILEKQMPKATPVTAQEPDAPATDDVGAWLKARRLGAFAGGLLAMGVECVEDLYDVEPEDMSPTLGMMHQQRMALKELAQLATYCSRLQADVGRTRPTEGTTRYLEVSERHRADDDRRGLRRGAAAVVAGNGTGTRRAPPPRAAACRSAAMVVARRGLGGRVSGRFINASALASASASQPSWAGFFFFASASRWAARARAAVQAARVPAVPAVRPFGPLAALVIRIFFDASCAIASPSSSGILSGGALAAEEKLIASLIDAEMACSLC